jgi:DNA-binding transcriptional MocR family regulator
VSRVSSKFSWERAIAASDLEGTTRHVAFTLGLHFSRAGDSCWPSLETLARESGLNVSTVKRHLTVLRVRGWLLVLSGGSPKGGERTSNRYEAAIPARWSLTGGTEDRVQYAPGAEEATTRGTEGHDRAHSAPLTINNNQEQSADNVSEVRKLRESLETSE